MPAELVMVLLGLDGLFVEPRRRLVALRVAEADELGVAHERQRLAGELPGSDARDGEDAAPSDRAPERPRCDVA